MNVAAPESALRTPGAAPDIALQVTGVSKRYPGTQALDDVSLTMRRGEIHALVGGNGSGKSTMIKILAGVVEADSGTLEIGGTPLSLSEHSAARAREHKLRFVHQQGSLFSELTVAENLSLGRGFETGFAGRIRWSQVNARAREVLERFDIGVAPSTPMSTVGPATQMMIAIARALQDQEGDRDSVLVLDEPTASLPPHEVNLLLAALRRYAAQGQTILYVTHRLKEVRDIADAATVFRDGRLVGTLRADQISHDSLVEAITGKALALENAVAAERRPVRAAGDRDASAVPTISAKGIAGGTVDLELYPGEVTGLAGLLGSGRSAILRSLFGLTTSEKAEVRLDGKPVTIDSPTSAMKLGIAYVPENRADASLPEDSIAHNLSVARLNDIPRFGWINERAERSTARKLIEAFRVRTSSETSNLSSLSGGNAQKVMLARWMQRNPRVLLLDEPSQGVDVGARAEIHHLIREAADRGVAVLVVTSDLEELAIVADRVLVVANGRIEDELVGDQVDTDVIESAMYTHGAN